MATAALDDGMTAIISGQKGGAGTPTLTTTDGAATISDNGVGDYTINFVAAFNSTPTVVATVIDATVATDAIDTIVIVAVTSTDVQFNTLTTTGTSVLPTAAEIDFHFMVVGKRNR